jgi:hypothetical protein
LDKRGAAPCDPNFKAWLQKLQQQAEADLAILILNVKIGENETS